MNDLRNTCRNCKFWDRDGVSKSYIRNSVYDIYGECSRPYQVDSRPWMEAICMSEGIAGELMTREDFGCVAFECKDR